MPPTRGTVPVRTNDHSSGPAHRCLNRGDQPRESGQIKGEGLGWASRRVGKRPGGGGDRGTEGMSPQGGGARDTPDHQPSSTDRHGGSGLGRTSTWRCQGRGWGRQGTGPRPPATPRWPAGGCRGRRGVRRGVLPPHGWGVRSSRLPFHCLHAATTLPSCPATTPRTPFLRSAASDSSPSPSLAKCVANMDHIGLRRQLQVCGRTRIHPRLTPRKT